MQYDIVVVGGGIVGLATALNLLEGSIKPKLLLLEKENELAMHQSKHNSGVIHSGIYYKPGGLKAINCLRGYHLLNKFCAQHEIPFEICGKVIVATTAREVLYLHDLFERGQQNGLGKLKKLKGEELKEYEPHVAGMAGLFVPQTGVVDFSVVAKKYGELVIQRGGEIRLNQQVVNICKQHDGYTVVTQSESITTKLLINCGGLYADSIARMAGEELAFRIIPFRGEYYMLREHKKYLVNKLIYPVPNPDFPFLGTHFTRTIAGHVEAGPNAVFAFKKEGYKKSDVNFSELMDSLMWPGFVKIMFNYWKTGIGEMYRSYSKSAFTKSLQRLIPELQKDDIIKAGTGVRAQACSRSGKLIDDFVIVENKNAVHVCNAPSPAATSSLAIGETIARRIEKKL